MKTFPLFENPEFVTRGDELIGYYRDAQLRFPYSGGVENPVEDFVQENGITPDRVPLLDENILADICRDMFTRYFAKKQAREECFGRSQDAQEAIFDLLDAYRMHPIAVESVSYDAVEHDGAFERTSRSRATGFLSGIYIPNTLAIKRRANHRDSFRHHKFLAAVIGNNNTPAIRLAIGDPS